MSIQNLFLIKQIYEEYNEYPILQQLAREIGWTTNSVILQKVKDVEERAFLSSTNFWSKSE
jgi:predicted nuclease of restriction endonuclease-like (RecB) superfamily